ncbi:MAG: CapA family protein [Gemmatimonadota bacterium]
MRSVPVRPPRFQRTPIRGGAGWSVLGACALLAAPADVGAQAPIPPSVRARVPVPPVDAPPTGIRLIAVGDVMPGSAFPDPAYLDPRLAGGAGPEAVLGRDLVELLRSGDVTFGNMEGVLWDADVPPAKRCSNPDLCYVFRGPERHAPLLAEAGFTVMSLANNHSGDWGPQGRDATIAALRSAGIDVAGLDRDDARTASLELPDGTRVGVAAFAPNRGTLDLLNLPAARRLVGELAAGHDIVVVSFHGGAEGAKHTRVPKRMETFLGERRGDVHAFAHAVVDAGADVVIGHGPHVPRAVEVRNDRFIAYSLGNFWTYGRFNLRGANGLAPVVELRLARDGRLLGARVHAARQQGRGGPGLDPTGAAIRLVAELTASDLSEAGLHLESDGTIRWAGADAGIRTSPEEVLP